MDGIELINKMVETSGNNFHVKVKNYLESKNWTTPVPGELLFKPKLANETSRVKVLANGIDYDLPRIIVV